MIHNISWPFVRPDSDPEDGERIAREPVRVIVQWWSRLLRYREEG